MVIIVAQNAVKTRIQRVSAEKMKGGISGFWELLFEQLWYKTPYFAYAFCAPKFEIVSCWRVLNRGFCLNLAEKRQPCLFAANMQRKRFDPLLVERGQ